jgi:Mrp family chromosome partitioning ATPase
MSRDFELLQRLEREEVRPSIFLETTGRAPSSEKQAGAFRTARRATQAARPSTRISPIVRAELNRMILRTFLAEPSISSVMFTGVEAKEGAKWLAACTADVLAETCNARVCLVDADLGSPAMHRAYSVPNHNGLRMILSGECPIDRAAIGISDNLWIIPAGVGSEGYSISYEVVRRAFYKIQQECEYLIVSGPECGSYQEIAAFGAATEGAILVLDATNTRRASAQRAKSMLEAAQLKLMGSVMTCRREPIPEFLSAHI